MLGREHSGKVSKKFIGNFYFWGITLIKRLVPSRLESESKKHQNKTNRSSHYWPKKACTWGAGMAQRSERSPPNNVSRVRFPHPASQVGLFCCWFSSLHRGFFSGFSGFPPSTKTNTPNSNSIRAFDYHVMLKCALQVLSTNWFILSTFRIQLPQRSEKAVVGVTYCSLLHEVVSFFFSHTTNSQSIFKCRENKPEHRLKSPRICKTREEFLIPKGKTLEPSGVKQAWRNLIYLFFYVSPLVHVSFSSIFVNQSCHMYMFSLVSFKIL